MATTLFIFGPTEYKVNDEKALDNQLTVDYLVTGNLFNFSQD